MKILVTGGAGFIGSHTIKKLLSLGHEPVCVDNFNSIKYSEDIKKYNIKSFENNVKIYKEDITNYEGLEKIFKENKIDKVCHLAAMAGISLSIKEPFLYENVNIKGTLNLLELSVKNNIENFVFASSSSVYGGNNKIPFCETDNVDKPLSIYAATKKSNELFAYTYNNIYKLPCTGLRFFTVYGPSGRIDMAPFIFTNKMFKGEKITRYGDGTTKRDYTFIDDIVSGVVSALDKNLNYEIINLGNNNPIELNHFISIIENRLNKKAIIEEKPVEDWDAKITYANIEKAKKILNYNPKTTIEDGMAKYIDWYMENRYLYEKN